MSLYKNNPSYANMSMIFLEIQQEKLVSWHIPYHVLTSWILKLTMPL